MNKKIVIVVAIFLSIIVVGTLCYVIFTPSPPISLTLRIKDFVTWGIQEDDASPLGFHIIIRTDNANFWLHDIEVETYATLVNGNRIEGFKLPEDVEPTDEHVAFLQQWFGERILCRRFVNASYIQVAKIEATLRTKEGNWTAILQFPHL